MELLLLFTVTVSPAVLAPVRPGAFGRIKTFIAYAAEPFVLALANAFLVKVFAIRFTHLNFSMCSARLF